MKGKDSRLWGKTAASSFTNEQSLQGGAFSWDLLDQNSKSPLFPGGGGRGYKWLVHNIRFRGVSKGDCTCGFVTYYNKEVIWEAQGVLQSTIMQTT